MKAYAALDDKYFPAQQIAASLIDLAANRGVDRNKLLRGTCIFYEDMREGTSLLCASQMLRLMANARQLMPGNDAAFQLGRRLFPGHYSQASNLLLQSQNLRDAFRLYSLVKMQLFPFVQTRLYRHEQCCFLLLDDAIGCGNEYQFVIETYCAALVSACRLLLGQRIPFHFDFPFPRPRYIQEFEENLGYRLRFSQPFLCIRFDQRYLHYACPQASQTLRWHALRQLHRSSQAPRLGFLEVIRQHIINDKNTNLQEIAAALVISPATLKRRLKQHGTSFMQLQDEVHRQQALYLLHVKGLNNEDIAAQMAFNDIPNFRRAFKRWTGSTPSQARLSWKLIDFSG
ncbi:AraC family transcriptional regulator [Bowmanella pacifica]|uniref:AraC family transcriptional regulator n=1 Tax=Bowmanella pacifica TaxID=502051 RepID=A0A917Z6D8_9ALTE|nr:AraC family transcriptional regulator [Bowmanella pacifica]GGO75234.1 AraC family transcriptional regulator [Bowmanella pacifica]